MKEEEEVLNSSGAAGRGVPKGLLLAWFVSSVAEHGRALWCRTVTLAYSSVPGLKLQAALGPELWDRDTEDQVWQLDLPAVLSV
mmetsp:Transcript_18815/g.52472  ORF Transcript_18815/g.52472 Transcript_18815/m.52472 type:complete len:84 (+) Transcript_18815:342-593(+)